MTRSLCGVCLVVLLAPLLQCTPRVETSPRAHSSGILPPPRDDDSQCEREGQDGLQAINSPSPGSRQANVRRVYRVGGKGADQRLTLQCREADSNLDGKKDVFRSYDERGNAVSERADSNYDGKLDTFVTFAGGQVVRIERDRDGDGRADEMRHYQQGRLSRVQRDSNADGAIDTWEVYGKQGGLERVGLDQDFDGVVDRWLRNLEPAAPAR
jgi:hypothetical protein